MLRSPAAFVLTLFCAPAAAQAPQTSGALGAGPHPVGFVSSWELDAERPWQMTFADGTKYAEEPAPRPVLVNLWYPAAKSDGEAMVERDYFQLPCADERVVRFARALVVYERGVLASELLAKDEPDFSAKERELFEGFLDTPISCRRGATPADSRAPLIVYHAGYGSSFEDNAGLCEFLASHGYVVAGSAFPSGDGSSFNIDAHEATARDIEFLIEVLGRQRNVDAGHIGLVGHSGGAHAALRQCTRSEQRLAAVVSLDTTQDYYSNLDPRWKDLTEPLLAHVERVTMPLLMAADPHGFFQLADALTSAPRWYFTLPLEHEQFISQGVVRAELDAVRAPAEGAELARVSAEHVRASNEALCRFVLAFFDAHLKSDSSARELLATQYRATKLGGSEPHVEFMAVGQSSPPPFDPESAEVPTPRQLRPFLAAHGDAATVALLRKFGGVEPPPPIFQRVFAFALVWELAQRGDLDSARTLGRAYVELVPELLGTIAAIGDLFQRLGQHDFASSCWRELLLLDPENAAAKEHLAGK